MGRDIGLVGWCGKKWSIERVRVKPYTPFPTQSSVSIPLPLNCGTSHNKTNSLIASYSFSSSSLLFSSLLFCVSEWEWRRWLHLLLSTRPSSPPTPLFQSYHLFNPSSLPNFLAYPYHLLFPPPKDYLPSLASPSNVLFPKPQNPKLVVITSHSLLFFIFQFYHWQSVVNQWFKFIGLGIRSNFFYWAA